MSTNVFTGEMSGELLHHVLGLDCIGPVPGPGGGRAVAGQTVLEQVVLVSPGAPVGDQARPGTRALTCLLAVGICAGASSAAES